MLSTLARQAAVVRSSACSALRCTAVPLRHMSVAYKASATAAATQPIQTRKPVKERIPGTLIDNVSTGADTTDRTLGETTPPDSLRDLPYSDIRVSDILHRKEKFGSTLHSVSERDLVHSAMQLMNTYNIGALLVTADGDPGTIVGILSTRDFIKHVTDDGADPRRSHVGDMMSREPVFTYSDCTALHCMALMNQGGFRHLPVRDRLTNRTIGVLSIGDCVRTLMTAFREKNEFLEELVAGKYPA